MNEIFKGMDNAAEQINENFQGLVVDSGSNENGSWVKLPDGRYFCQKKITEDGSANQINGIWDTGVSTWYFPIEFNETPLVWANAGHENDWANGRALGTTSAQFRTFSNRPMSGLITIFVFAIGR